MNSKADDRLIERQLRPILASIRSTALTTGNAQNLGSPPASDARRSFVTISRQPGAGAWSLANKLVARLNELDPRDPPWSCWERELVEKVAADHHISRDLVESLEERSRSWLQDALAGLSAHSEYAEEYAVYRRVAATIRALAQLGRVVIVGRGGVYVTRGMPGGIHFRLVAPIAFRIASLSRDLKVSEADAAGVLREMERARERFYHRYWPQESLIPEVFTAVVNTQAVGEQRLTEWIAALVVPQRSQHAAVE